MFRLGIAQTKIVLQRNYNTYNQKHTISSACPNQLKKQFYSKISNRIWISDTSYILVKKGFVYFSVILNIFSKKLIDWNVNVEQTVQLMH